MRTFSPCRWPLLACALLCSCGGEVSNLPLMNDPMNGAVSNTSQSRDRSGESYIVQEYDGSQSDKSTRLRKSVYLARDGSEVQHGKQTVFSDNKIVFEATYHHGLLWGVRRGWHDSEELSHLYCYRNGAKDGPMMDFDESGRPISFTYVRDDKVDGPYVEWYSTGHVKATGQFKSGNKHGRWTDFTAAGEVSRVQYYRNGQLAPDGD